LPKWAKTVIKDGFVNRVAQWAKIRLQPGGETGGRKFISGIRVSQGASGGAGVGGGGSRVLHRTRSKSRTQKKEARKLKLGKEKRFHGTHERWSLRGPGGAGPCYRDEEWERVPEGEKGKKKTARGNVKAP